MFNFVYHEEILNGYLPQSEHRSIRMWAKFIALGMLDPADRRLASLDSHDDSQESFKIPNSRPASSGDWTGLFAIAMIPLADALFPRESWLWTVQREVGFVISGQGEYSLPQLMNILKSKDFGPLGMLAVANFLDGSGLRRWAPTFAKSGLQRLTIGDFRKDYGPLLGDRHVVGECVLRACEIIRQFDEHEMKDFFASLPDRWRPSFAAFAKELHRDVRRSPRDAATAALDNAWKMGLRTEIERMLSDIARRGEKVRNARR